MAESTTDVYIKLFQIVIITTVLVVLYHRKRQYRLDSLKWLITIFALADLQGISELIIYYIKIYVLELSNPSAFRFNEVHTVIYGFAIFAIYIFAEQLHSLHPNVYRFGLVSLLFGMYLSLLFYKIFNNYDIVFHDSTADDQIYSTYFDFFQMFAMLFVTYVFFKSYTLSQDPNNRRASLYTFIGTLVYVLVTLYEIGETLLGFPNVYGALTYSLTFLIFAYVYIRNPFFVFAIPTRVHRIILTTTAGIYLYGADIAKDTGDAPDELLAGGISAIIGFLTELTGSSVPDLKYALVGDRALVIRRQKELIGFIITDKSTGMLTSALDQFVSDFSYFYRKELTEFRSDIGQFVEAPAMIARNFPFVEASEIKQFQTTHDLNFAMGQ